MRTVVEGSETGHCVLSSRTQWHPTGCSKGCMTTVDMKQRPCIKPLRPRKRPEKVAILFVGNLHILRPELDHMSRRA